MAIWKFCYRQLFGKLGWSVKKWLDRYQTLQPHVDAWKGPVYQISARLARNCRSYPIFSLLVGRSGWSVTKRLDRYQMLQPHADAWKGPAYQIIAWSVRNCQSYPIFSLLVGRSVGGVARPQFFLFCSPKTWQEHPTYVPEHIADISKTKIENWFSSTILLLVRQFPINDQKYR